MTMNVHNGKVDRLFVIDYVYMYIFEKPTLNVSFEQAHRIIH